MFDELHNDFSFKDLRKFNLKGTIIACKLNTGSESDFLREC